MNEVTSIALFILVLGVPLSVAVAFCLSLILARTNRYVELLACEAAGISCWLAFLWWWIDRFVH